MTEPCILGYLGEEVACKFLANPEVPFLILSPTYSAQHLILFSRTILMTQLDFAIPFLFWAVTIGTILTSEVIA